MTLPLPVVMYEAENHKAHLMAPVGKDLPPALSKRERPILFSAPMVRALLAGTKTQTRRVCKRPPTWEHTKPLVGSNAGTWYIATSKFARVGFAGYAERVPQELMDELLALSPYGQPGDRLWVREAWHVHPAFNDRKPSLLSRCDVGYVADGAPKTHWGKTRPSMFMPRWASRILLEVAEVRVQRLQSISDADAQAEGTPCYVCGRIMDGLSEDDCHCFHRAAHATDYRDLWESINGAGSWDANPWVWAVSFKPSR